MAIAAILWIFVKLPQEYWIHIAQLDFTETVDDYPWFGVLCALAVLGLVAVAWFVVRPRMPAPDWGWRFAADPLPASLDDAHERHAHRLRRGGVLWGELAEKIFLLALMSVIFAEILPSVEASAVEVGLGRRRDRGRQHRRVACSPRAASASRGCRSPACWRRTSAFIYLLSTFFSPAEDFPLGTALFFAFLITLLLWLYDVYKPVYDVRFLRRRASIGPARRAAAARSRRWPEAGRSSSSGSSRSRPARRRRRRRSAPRRGRRRTGRCPTRARAGPRRRRALRRSATRRRGRTVPRRGAAPDSLWSR